MKTEFSSSFDYCNLAKSLIITLTMITYTMIGDGDMKYPGIAPRAFDRIFDLVEENK